MDQEKDSDENSNAELNHSTTNNEMSNGQEDKNLDKIENTDIDNNDTKVETSDQYSNKSDNNEAIESVIINTPEIHTPSLINELEGTENDEKVVKEKGPGINNTKILNNTLLNPSNKSINLVYSSSQSSLSLTELTAENNVEECDSDTNEFPIDFEETTNKLLELKDRILDSSREMLKSSVVLNENNDYTVSPKSKESPVSINNKESTNNNPSLNSHNSFNSTESLSTSLTETYGINNNSTPYIPVYEYRKIFEYTPEEIKLFNEIEDYSLTSKVRLNNDLDENKDDDVLTKKLKDEQVLIYEKLKSTRNSLHKEMESHIHTINENKDLKKQIQELQNALIEKDNTIHELQGKLDNEIENSKVYRKEKKTVQDELEELTKSLFEEANKLVADEARKRHQVEKLNKAVSNKLKDSQFQLEAETQQLKELRAKMEEMNQENEKNQKIMEETNKRMSIISELSDDSIYDVETIDTYLLAEFKDFISSAINVRMSKLHNIPYMRNCLEDDIMPCLRFSSDPKISWKRLTEEIAANSLLLQEISHQDSRSPSPPSNANTDYINSLNASTPSSSMSNLNNTSSSNSLNTKPTSTSSQQNNRSSMWVRLSMQAGFGSGVIFDPVFNGCQACGRPNSQSSPIRFQFRIDKSEKSEHPTWSPLCAVCRDRIVACCEFYNFIRHIRQGLYTNRGIAELYYESVRLKRQMFYARLGALNQSDLDYGFGKLPRLTQGTYNNLYRRSISLQPARSEYGSASSIAGSISSPVNQFPPTILQALPVNLESSTTDSSQNSLT